MWACTGTVAAQGGRMGWRSGTSSQRVGGGGGRSSRVVGRGVHIVVAQVWSSVGGVLNKGEVVEIRKVSFFAGRQRHCTCLVLALARETLLGPVDFECSFVRAPALQVCPSFICLTAFPLQSLERKSSRLGSLCCVYSLSLVRPRWKATYQTPSVPHCTPELELLLSAWLRPCTSLWFSVTKKFIICRQKATT